MTAAVIGSIIQDKRKPTSLPARCKVTAHRRSSAALASQSLKRKKRGRGRKSVNTLEKPREGKSPNLDVPSSKSLKREEDKVSSKQSDVKVFNSTLPKRRGRPKKSDVLAKPPEVECEVFDAKKLTCNNSDYLGSAMGAQPAFSPIKSIPTVPVEVLAAAHVLGKQNEAAVRGGGCPAQASKPPLERPDSLPSKSDRLCPDLDKVLPQLDQCPPGTPLALPPAPTSTNLNLSHLSSLILPKAKSKRHRSSLSFSKMGYQFKVNPFRPQDACQQEKKQKPHRHHRRTRSVASSHSHPCYKTGRKHASLMGKSNHDHLTFDITSVLIIIIETSYDYN